MTRIVGWLLLLVAGMACLPAAAFLLDGQGTENWILPVDLLVMAGVGALVGLGLPGFLAGSTRRRLLLGAACGGAAAVVGVLVFFLLLSGLRGA
ncbi:MAG: hypothetical protein U0R80_16185 [Nocardioidaceae bacterium]